MSAFSAASPASARELPRLAELGITAVELMPIAEFPGARNWGYDGVLPFAPERSYGTPDDLKALIDAAHEHGLMIFLDVVYNHFGPDGNYLPLYAPDMFRNDVSTPWGPAIDFRRKEVRRFFTENALYWLIEYRFDGLRFDAVHAMTEPDWLDEMAAEVRSTVGAGAPRASRARERQQRRRVILQRDFDAQWNDDGHHVLHVLLTGERDGYYEDYADDPAERLARCLAEGFIYQGEPSPHRNGKPRGTPSADLPPTAFVLFLQNHDQIGNRAFGERLTTLADPAALEAAIALQLLCPQIPLALHGRGTGEPHAVSVLHRSQRGARQSRARRQTARVRRLFAISPIRSGLRELPDPNAPDHLRSLETRCRPDARRKRELLYQRLLDVAPLRIRSSAQGCGVRSKPVP